LPGGIFATESEARATYSWLRAEISVEPLAPGTEETWRRVAEEYERAVLWYARCEPDAIELLEETDLEGAQVLRSKATSDPHIDCNGVPPDLPKMEAPRGPEVPESRKRSTGEPE
jgi:hypothetical protein